MGFYGQTKIGFDYQNQAEWSISFEDGDKNTGYITIYDWKEDTIPQEVTTWHIGGVKVVSFPVLDLKEYITKEDTK